VVAVAVVASPRDGNTTAAVGDLLGGLEQGGAATSAIDVTQLRVEPIGDCTACIEAGHCPLDGDDFAAAMEEVYAADLLVLASPLYWYGVSAQLKAFLDRWSCLLDRDEEAFRARMRGKPAAVVLAQGERGFYEAGPCLQMLEWTVRYMEMPLVARIVVVGHARGDYRSDAPQREQVRAAGRRLVDAASADVLPPWFHVTVVPGERLGGIFNP
jgi:multimeric flavodoxin WrbA